MATAANPYVAGTGRHQSTGRPHAANVARQHVGKPGAEPASSTYDAALPAAPQASATVRPVTEKPSVPGAVGTAQPDGTSTTTSFDDAPVPQAMAARART